jgi:hypothetical protein
LLTSILGTRAKVGAAAAIVKVCWTMGAVAQVGSPAWLPSTEQRPGASKRTMPAEIEQIAVLAALMLKVTGRPDPAVAVGV